MVEIQPPQTNGYQQQSHAVQGCMRVDLAVSSTQCPLEKKLTQDNDRQLVYPQLVEVVDLILRVVSVTWKWLVVLPYNPLI